MRTLLLLQLAIAGYFTGIIWLVQTIVYPLLLKIPEASFLDYHSAYSRTMSWVVGPLMILELGLSFAMLALFREQGDWWWRLGALGLTGICWLSTAFIQVPLHARLSQDGWNAETIRQLVDTNWIRTLAWTARLMVLGLWIQVHSRLA